MWASIWFARRAGEGGKGMVRARERVRAGVLRRALLGLEVSLWLVRGVVSAAVRGGLFIGGCCALGWVRCDALGMRWACATHSSGASFSSSRALIVCRLALGFFSVGTVPVAGSCFTGDNGSTV